MFNRQNISFIDYVDELVDSLAEVDIHAMPTGSIRHSGHKDPLSHLHETFLEQNNPRLRELRGVYYTPEPLVSYIVRCIDFLLRALFNCHDGLAEEAKDITIVDPACGTGIFLQAVVKHIRAEFQKTGEPQRWPEYVRSHLLPHLFGFELLADPYIIAHRKLVSQLAALDLPESERHTWAYHFEHDEHLNIYLTNTLEQGSGWKWTGQIRTERGQAPPLQYTNQGVDKFSEYCRGGGLPRPGLDTHRPAGTSSIMVVLGNPPYAGHSANKGQWINMLLDAYKAGYPELKKPGQAKWLSDDYVKFMRFAQWQIEQAGKGILAFITNHSYLDNPTFRGMRRSLLQSFDDIYILDLHGNSKKQEQAPDGSKDENVFDIQQGVAISVFVKHRDSGTFGTVHHSDLWGLREVYELDTQGQAILTGGKYSWLAEHDLASTRWQTIDPQPPFYLFVPQDNQYLAEYQRGWSVADIFRPNGDPAPGVVTCHDQFAISWTAGEASDKVERFLLTETETEARRLFRLCSQNQWQYAVAKSELQRGMWHQDVTEILYRPFDRRWTIFNRYVAVHRRERVMRHMLAGENIGLTIGRAGQVIDQDEWDIVFCTRLITEFNLYRRGGNNLFPLYLYIDPSSGIRQVNLASDFLMALTGRLQLAWVRSGQGDLQQTLGPHDIFHYMYAIFFSPAYRKRYAPFLKVDFPRLPLTSNCTLFRALCSIGDRLVGLHLMEQCIPLISYFPVPGDNRIEAVRYIAHRQPEDEGLIYSHPSNHAELRQIGNEASASTAPQSSDLQGVGASIFAEQKSGGVKGKIWINATQYFENVPLEAWNFSIGGYKVCQKWLKDRQGRKLNDEDLAHYQQVIAILGETSDLMCEIDQVIEKCGGWPL
jgi:predicted helicase